MGRVSSCIAVGLLAAALAARADPLVPPPVAPVDTVPPSLAPLSDPWAGSGIRLVGAPYARYSPETAWALGAGDWR